MSATEWHTTEHFFVFVDIYCYKKDKYEISDAVLQTFVAKNVAIFSFKRQWNDGIVSEDIKWWVSSNSC